MSFLKSVWRWLFSPRLLPRVVRWTAAVFCGLAAILLVGLCVLIWSCLPPHRKAGEPLVTISEETTRITEPLREDGYVDYVAALNRQCGEGVTPENNAAVLLMKAFGPGEIPSEMRSPFFEALGIPELPDKGEYFESFGDYVKRLHGDDPFLLEDSGDVEEEDDPSARLSKAMSRPWSAAEYPEIAEWLAANQQPLGLVTDAAQRPRYYMPLVSSDASTMIIAMLLPNISPLRDSVHALAARAMFRVQAGRIDEAWQDLLACQRLARLVAQNPTLVELLVGIAIDNIACRNDMRFAHHAQLTAEQAHRFRADLAALPPMPSAVDKLDVGERYVFLDAVCGVARAGPQAMDALDGEAGNSVSRFTPVDWDIVLRMGNSWYDRQVEAGHMPRGVARQKALNKLSDEFEESARRHRGLKSMARSLFHGDSPRTILSNRIGLTFLAVTIPAFAQVLVAEDRATAWREMADLSLVLAAYRADHGAYPPTLDALAPEYVSELPRDVFGPGPNRYKPAGEGYVLYSIGPNGIDDGGHDEFADDLDAAGDDIVFRTRVKKS